MIELNEKNFKSTLKDKELVIVDFFATWCGPCSMQSEVLNEIGESRNLKFDIAKINVDDSPKIAEEYGIESIPTLIVFKKGQAIKRIVGLTSKEEISNTMEEYLV